MFAPQVMSPAPMPGSIPHTSQVGISPLRRSNSLSWRAEAGLPPPPSEIDQYPHLHQLMSPAMELERARSPASAYDGLSSADAMPMHAVAKHPKLKLRIVLASSIFEAGSTVSGALEITSSTSQRLRLGEIAVELEAFEELSSRDHSATQIFLFNRTLFQGEHLPPSNAVLPSAPVQGHWTARKGRTTFPFSFRLPTTVPSSIAFAGNANLRYTLKATAQTWWNETKSLVTVRSEAFVVERWEDEFDPRYLEPVEAIADTQVFMGGNGAVWLEAGVSEQLFVAGSMLMIRAGVKNNSKRHLSGIKVAIARRLIFPVSGPPGKPAQRPSLGPQITETVHSQLFKGPSYEFPPNEEVVVNLAVDIPRDLRTVRKTRLFEVQTLAIVSAQMGNFAKDLAVEVPFFVAHPGSLQRPAARSFEPLNNLPQRSRSAMAQHGQHQQHAVAPPSHAHQYSPHVPNSPHPDPSMAQVEAYAAQRGWSPAPPHHAHAAPPSRPSSAAANVGALVSLPSTPQPFSFHPAGHGNGQQVVWDTNAPGWTTSALLPSVSLPQRPTSAQEKAPRQIAPPEVMLNLSAAQRREPTTGSTYLLQQQQQQQQQHQHQHQQQQQQPQQQPQQQQQQSRRASAPGGMELQQQQHEQAYTRSTLAASPQAQPLAPPQPVTPHGPNLPDNDQQALSVPYVPSPSQILGANGQPLGLATIEEDSESAAGTVRSLRTLVGSVTRGDIDQFEQMVQRADDEEEMRKAMHEVGMVPDDGQARRMYEGGQQSIAADKSLPKPPPLKSASKAEQNASRRVKASDIFDQQLVANHSTAVPRPAAQVERRGEQSGASTKDERQKDRQQKPARPASAQGVGLAALESRLKTPTPSQTKARASAGRKSEPHQRVTEPSLMVAANVGRRSSSGSIAEASAIRAAATAAAERERRAREDEEARRREETLRKDDEGRKKRRQSELLAAKQHDEGQLRPKQVVEESKQTTSSSQPAQDTNSRATSTERRAGERKEVDLHEQRKLNKEAVGRVAGWLSTSPSQKLDRSLHVEQDPALSPKTPSPSVLHGEAEIVGAGSELALPKASAFTLRALTDRQDQTESLSQDLRTLIDSSKDLPKPKRGTSIVSHPSTRRFSGETIAAHKQNGEEVGMKQIPDRLSEQHSTVQASKEKGQPRKVEDEITVPEAFKKSLLSKANTEGAAPDETTTASKYDVRSARGGRGGRVASVANMWASIAEGTDGSQAKDTSPVVTLKPKALRSGKASALDFSKASGTSVPATAKTQTSPPLIANNRVKSPTGKATSAPQFVNTTIPRAVFASPASPSSKENVAMPPPTRKLSIESNDGNAMSQQHPQGRLKASRKITSDLIAAEARMRAGRDLAQDAEDALPMNGRGTTRPIGREKLADLRSLWGG